MKTEFGQKNRRSPISADLVHKTLNMMPDTFTCRDLKEKMDKRKVFGTVSIKTAYSRILRMRNINALKIHTRRAKARGGNIYTATDQYKTNKG